MTGIDAFLAIGQETTPGTYLAPARFMDFLDEDISLEIDPIESNGLRGRKTNHQWAQGARRVQGSVNMEVGPQGVGLLLENLFGGAAVTTNPGGGTPEYQHVFNLGTFYDKSMTVQVGRPDDSGTIHPFSYVGCVISDFEFSIASTELLMLTFNVYGQDEDTGQTAVTPSYSAYIPFTFKDGSLKITPAGGSETDICVTDWSLAGDSAMRTDAYFICDADTAGKPRRGRENGLREYTGSFTGDFEDMTWYNWFRNGTEGNMVMTFTAATGEELEFDLNVRFDGSTPTVGGPEILEQAINYKVTSGTSDADAITVTLRNDDSAV